MSGKCNTQHPDRSRSNYPLRLAKRGLTRTPEMESLENLRSRQERREEQTGAPWWTGRDVDTEAA